jgi:hypothetical protein
MLKAFSAVLAKLERRLLFGPMNFHQLQTNLFQLFPGHRHDDIRIWPSKLHHFCRINLPSTISASVVCLAHEGYKTYLDPRYVCSLLFDKFLEALDLFKGNPLYPVSNRDEMDASQHVYTLRHTEQLLESIDPQLYVEHCFQGHLPARRSNHQRRSWRVRLSLHRK